jgi:DNA-binding winged helix-turn-helix (wHTH) protein/TolB-like protein
MNQSAQPVYRFGPFHYDCGQRLLFLEGEKVPLAPKLSETLRVLLERHGRVVEKADLMRAVWPDTTVEEIGLARNISQLRKALGGNGETGGFIETVPKRGYRFVGEVVEANSGADDHRSAKSTPRWMWRSRNLLTATGLVCLMLGLIYWQFYRPSRYLATGTHTARIAVIPFECLSPGLDCYAFPHGLTDLLVARVSQFEDIHVLSQSTVYRFQRGRLSMPFMARVLGMDVTLEGSIQRAGDQVRITARLVDVHSATLVWSNSYEYPVQRIADAESQASQDIAAQVGAHLAARREPSRANR